MPSCFLLNFQFLPSLEQLRRQSAHCKRVFGIDHFINNNAKQPDRISKHIIWIHLCCTVQRRRCTNCTILHLWKLNSFLGKLALHKYSRRWRHYCNHCWRDIDSVYIEWFVLPACTVGSLLTAPFKHKLILDAIFLFIYLPMICLLVLSSEYSG